MKKIVKEVPAQGNKVTDDPTKFGLKFDTGKARWELVPMQQLLKVIRNARSYISTSSSDLMDFNMTRIYNNVMDYFSKYIMTGKQECLLDAAFETFFLLRGKSYTAQELGAADNDYRWDMFEPRDLEGVVSIYTYGAKLYTEGNWKKVSKERYIAAFFRHFTTVMTKKRYDDESGSLHLYHALWNLIAIIWCDDNAGKEVA